MKTISTVVRISTQGLPPRPSLWHEPALYIAATGLAFSAPSQLYLLNAALASSTLNLAVPAYQSFIILLTIASGGIFFQEFADYTAASAIAFFAAVIAVMTGLAILSYHVRTSPTHHGSRPPILTIVSSYPPLRSTLPPLA